VRNSTIITISRNNIYFLSTKPATSVLGRTQPPSQRVQGSFSGTKRSDHELTTHLHLVSRIRISGAIPLLRLHALMAWTTTNLTVQRQCDKHSIPQICTIFTNHLLILITMVTCNTRSRPSEQDPCFLFGMSRAKACSWLLGYFDRSTPTFLGNMTPPSLM
jgi:hypothetical protein